jgi:proteasome lid subunit RPN8/RPN11
MSMEIAEPARRAIHRHLTTAYPLEACGLLLGAPDPDGGPRVETALRSENRRMGDGAAHHRYLISPDDFRAAAREAAAMGLDIVGTYHSHPDVAAVPSPYDLEHAWPWYRYLILSISNGVVRDERVWELREDRSAFIEHPLHVRKS